MKKSGKLLSILFLGLVLSVSFSFLVSATLDGLGGSVGVPQVVKDVYNNWAAGTIDPSFAKILIFILVFLVVFLALANIWSDEKHKWIVTTASVVISILATMYLIPSEVLALTLSYSALGLTIASIIPLALLLGFTFQAAKPESSVSLVFIQWLAWILFALYTLYKTFVAYNDTANYSAVVATILLIALIVSILMVIFNRKILIMIGSKLTDEEIDKAQDLRRRANAGRRIDAAALDERA